MKKIVCCALLLTSCGDGGGGGKSNPTDGLRIFHGAIESPPVDLFYTSKSGPLLAGSGSFGEGISRAPLPGGEQAITAILRQGPTLRTFRAEAGLAESPVLVVAGLPDDGTPLTTIVTDRVPDLGENTTGAVRLIHAVARAATIIARFDGNESITARFGNSSGYTVLPAKTYEVSVKREADGLLLSQTSVEVPPGSVTTLFVGGEAEYFVTTKVTQGE